MNNGAFGENFPYSNFHDLNMDWIIKIAKDFLDQYTHIQDTIDSGLTALQEKADTLETALQAWYDEHSEDIADQLASALSDLNDWYTEHSADIADELADALADLNDWYTTHQGYLDQYVTDSIAAFNTAANTKATETIASIPDDYTTLADNVSGLANAINAEMAYSDSIQDELYGYHNLINFADQSLNSEFSKATTPVRTRTSVRFENAEYNSSIWIPLNLTPGSYNLRFDFTTTDATYSNIRIYEEDKTTVVQAVQNGLDYVLTVAQNTLYYFRVYIISSDITFNITNAFCINTEAMLLKQKIGVAQFKEEVSQFFIKLDDVFANADETVPQSGVTRSKDNNEITITTSDTSAYAGYDCRLLANHKYAIYYDISGSGTGLTSFYLEFRTYSGGWKKTIASIAQTVGTSAVGTAFAEIGETEEGLFTINLPNHNGETITGDIYIYDVTAISNENLNKINFSSIGSGKTILIASNTTDEEDAWVNKKVVFYGDSITQGMYPEMVQSVMHFQLVKNAIGGTTFGYEDETSLSSDSRIENLPTDADVVCIMGGTNDWARTEMDTELVYNNGFDRTKFKGAVAYTVQKIQARCTHATIFLLTNIGGRGNSDPQVIQPLPPVSVNGNTPLTIRNATIEVAEYLNIPVIDTWECGINGFNRSQYIADSVHPNTEGCKLIADYVIHGLIAQHEM